MKVVIAAISDPWESSHGGTIRTRAFATSLRELGDDVVCVFPSARPRSRSEQGIELVGVAAAPAGGRTWPGPVRRLKRALLPMPTESGARSTALLSAVVEQRPDVVLVSQLPYAWYAEKSGTPLWLDHSDLWSDFIEREVLARRGIARVTARRQQRGLVTTETTRSRGAAVTTTAGWTDAGTLTGRTRRPVSWLPTPVGQPTGAPRRPAAGPPVVGFLANFGFWPNVDALDLLNEVWGPRLLADGWRVVVAGLQSDEMVVAPGIENLGAVDRVQDFYDVVDVTVAPIRLGGGMKVKVVESLMHGCPVMATSLALEGFPEEVRSLAHVVDALAPVFPPHDVLQDGRLAVSTGPLEPFTRAGFTRNVARLRQGLTS